MKTALLAVAITVMVFASPALAIDIQKLDTDTAVIGAFLQRIVSPKRRSNCPQSVAIYCEGYGVITTFCIYFDSGQGIDSQFSQDNEELTRGVALRLSSIRQLNKNERIIIAIKNSRQPYQVYTIQAQNNDLLSFLQGKIKLDDLSKRIKISKSASVEK